MSPGDRMLYAVVPVKTLVRAKTRLAPALSFTQRLLLARRFLQHTLAVLKNHAGADRTIVVSADPAVIEFARSKGMIALPQTARGGINRAVHLGCRLAQSLGATSILVLPTDLPHLTVGTLRAFTRRASTPIIRLAADRHKAGTNALFLQPPMCRFARFGPDSLRRHRVAGEEKGLKVEVVHDPALSLDVDLPGDLTEARIG